MSYLSYKAEDFALDGSFQNYCLGNNRGDIDFWEEWCEANPDKQPVILQAKQMVLILSAQTEQQLVEDRALFRTIMPSRTGSELPAVRSQHVPVRRLRSYIFRAAVVIIAFGLVAALIINNNNNNKTAESYTAREVSNAGEKKHFYLPDGTKVTLNAGSTIDISAQFNSEAREIVLTGEAFFEVAHDDQKPFIIHTHLMDIRVLGTTFNVKAYPDDKITETSLLEGSIEVTMKANSKEKIILKPKEKLIVPAPSAVAAAKSIPEPEQPFVVTQITYNKADSSLAEVSWTEDRLAFNDQTFEELARTLERWYNLNIRFEDEAVRDFRFTAIFERKNVAQVLKALQLSRQFKYTINGDEIIISK